MNHGERQFVALIMIDGLRNNGHRIWVEDNTFYIQDAYGRPCSRGLRAWIEPLAGDILQVLNAETEMLIQKAEELTGALH